MLTDYSAKQDSYFSADRSEMLSFVPPSAAAILEVGCGAGRFAALLKARQLCHITAIEPFAEASQHARAIVDRLIEADAETGIRHLSQARFDCVIFNDVLEHLVDPWSVLRDVKRLLSPSGVLVASIPNMRYAPILAGLVLKGDWQYRQHGVLDQTHLRFFTFKSAAQMFAVCGYSINRLQGVNPGRTWKFSLLRALTMGSMADLRFQQFAIVAGHEN